MINPPIGSDKTGSGDSTQTFDANITRIDAYNLHPTEPLKLTANGVMRYIPPNTPREVNWVEPFREVEVKAAGQWILSGYE